MRRLTSMTSKRKRDRPDPDPDPCDGFLTCQPINNIGRDAPMDAELTRLWKKDVASKVSSSVKTCDVTVFNRDYKAAKDEDVAAKSSWNLMNTVPSYGQLVIGRNHALHEGRYFECKRFRVINLPDEGDENASTKTATRFRFQIA
jgi:hypothetical protein